MDPYHVETDVYNVPQWSSTDVFYNDLDNYIYQFPSNPMGGKVSVPKLAARMGVTVCATVAALLVSAL